MNEIKSNYKTLYLLRHAKSSWSERNISDFERELNKRGKQQAPQIAAILASKSSRPQIIISSPANRASSTAKIMSTALGSDGLRVGSDKRIYEANIQTLMYLIQELDDDLSTVMLVGHNPGFSYLVNTLSRQKVAPLPTCALVQLRLDINHWNELKAECGELLSVDIPTKQQT